MPKIHINKNIDQTQTKSSSKAPTVKPPKIDLKNIIEVTEENQPTPTNSDQSCHSDEPQRTVSQMGCIKRLCNSLTYIWRLITNSSSSMHLNIDDDNFTEAINKIINDRQRCPIMLPAQKEPRRVLVLDLDQTLVHTTFTKPAKYDFQSQVMFAGRSTKIYTIKRFGLESFLFEMSKMYEIVVFTASQRMYADLVLDLIDPKKRIAHRMYREHCIVVNDCHYLKNLRVLGRDMKEMVVVDDNGVTGLLQPNNFYKIEPFTGNEKDRCLCRLGDFLRHVHSKKQIVPVEELRKEFEDREIELTEEDTSAIKPEKGTKERKRMHRRRISSCDFDAMVCGTTSATLSTEEEKECDLEAETTASELIKSM